MSSSDNLLNANEEEIKKNERKTMDKILKDFITSPVLLNVRNLVYCRPVATANYASKSDFPLKMPVEKHTQLDNE
jgi:hypothetical protein